MFEKIPIDHLVANTVLSFDNYPFDNQMLLF